MKTIIITFLLCIGFGLNAQVGINTDTPLSTLDINGNLSLMVVNYAGGPGGAATPIDEGIYLNLTPTAFNVEFLLPNAMAVPGRIYILRNISDTENALIYSNGGQFFPGDSRVATAAPITMTSDTAGDGGDITKTLIFVSDGTNWTYGHLGF
ncbi:hypothetical protein J4050_02840 [Winogradskyella sp. DF17]|uniref:Uncharacterized protein n=1 Tax=Winogradskyella pelagia TaxID=2819984 RepID=A0ABS3SYX4_9FLAO|nr:hypothetical protein [Winogradskyella sp. DF17]MBO3115664.1 hypothetical protein [Winogradskyella sp. DF17]